MQFLKKFIVTNIDYCTTTGGLFWKTKLPYRRKGGKATTAGNNGNIVRYPGFPVVAASKVIWFLMFKEFPRHKIIHVNGNSYDDRLINLAERFKWAKFKREQLTQKFLQSYLDYNPSNGYLYKKDTREVLGYLHHSNYVYLAIRGVIYSAHSLIWLLLYGYLTENQIDHKNGIRNDNRLINLQEVSRDCNLRNKQIYKNSSSGYRGISKDTVTNRWRAYGALKGKAIYLGVYKSKFDAVVVRLCWEHEESFSSCDLRSLNFKIFLQEYGNLAKKVINEFLS